MQQQIKANKIEIIKIRTEINEIESIQQRKSAKPEVGTLKRLIKLIKPYHD